MVVSTAWTGLQLFSSLSKKKKKNLPVLQFEESHSGDNCIRVRWSVRFFCRGP